MKEWNILGIYWRKKKDGRDTQRERKTDKERGRERGREQ